VQKNR